MSCASVMFYKEDDKSWSTRVIQHVVREIKKAGGLVCLFIYVITNLL